MHIKGARYNRPNPTAANRYLPRTSSRTANKDIQSSFQSDRSTSAFATSSAAFLANSGNRPSTQVLRDIHLE